MNCYVCNGSLKFLILRVISMLYIPRLLRSSSPSERCIFFIVPVIKSYLTFVKEKSHFSFIIIRNIYIHFPYEHFIFVSKSLLDPQNFHLTIVHRLRSSKFYTQVNLRNEESKKKRKLWKIDQFLSINKEEEAVSPFLLQ